MPITKAGWELLISRLREDSRNGRRRTIGQYKVFHNGAPVDVLSGMCAETRGPGDNSQAGNNRRIEAGRYPLLTQDGAKYVTIGYKDSTSSSVIPRPGLDVGKTNKRVGILIHPGRGFLSSVGCIIPAKALQTANADIDFIDSRARVIAIIDDMKSFVGASFPKENGRPIPDAFLVIDGEPQPLGWARLLKVVGRREHASQRTHTPGSSLHERDHKSKTCEQTVDVWQQAETQSAHFGARWLSMRSTGAWLGSNR